MNEYLLMMWDGLGFFGFDNAKLGRLKGEPVTYATKYKDATKFTISIVTILFVLYVTFQQVIKLGQEKD